MGKRGRIDGGMELAQVKSSSCEVVEDGSQGVINNGGKIGTCGVEEPLPYDHLRFPGGEHHVTPFTSFIFQSITMNENCNHPLALLSFFIDKKP